MIRVETVTNEEGLYALEKDWEQLLCQSNVSLPFLSYGWFVCCIAQEKERHALTILTVREGEELIGIGPLWQDTEEVRGTQVNMLKFIGNQDTPYADFIVSNRKRKAILEAIAAHLTGPLTEQWDLISLRQWPEESPNVQCFKDSMSQFGRTAVKHVFSQTPYVSINAPWEDFLCSKSPRLRKKLRNVSNRIDKLEAVEIECLKNGDPSTIMDQVLQVAKRGWKIEEGKSIANREEVVRFFTRLTETASQSGWLMVWILKTDGIPIAVEYDLASDGRVFALRSDFDEAYKWYSPGAYLETQILRCLSDNGYEEYSYGPGLNSYKLHWAEAVKTNFKMDFFNTTFKGKWIWFLESRIVPFARQIRDKLKPDPTYA